jgi:hypothetical protein
MSEKISRPGTVTEAALNDSGGHRIDKPNFTPVPASARKTEKVDTIKFVDYSQTVVDSKFESQLHWWALGFEARNAEVAQLKAERDSYYERAQNPGKALSEVRQRRIEQALIDNAAGFFGEISR